MQTHRLLLSILAAALFLGACGSTSYVRIRHPLQVGTVDPNTVPFQSLRDERRRGLPGGTLVDEAQLTTLTPDQICVRVSLWSTQLEPNRSNFQAYRIALLNDQSDVENTNVQIQAEAPQVASYQGVRGEARASSSTFMTRVNVPFVYDVTTQPAGLCFANGGFVTPATTHLTLELQDAGAGNRINFEWDFDSSVAQAQQ